MADSAKVLFNITNLINNVSTPLVGVIFVEGITKRGPIDDPDEIINSWPAFVKKFGGEISSSKFPTLCRLMFERGAKLRVNRITHYDTGATTAVKAPAVDITNDEVAPDTLFTVRPKYHGADYNNLSVVISTGSNGVTGYFDLQIQHTLEPSLNETYKNLIIPAAGTVDTLTFLDDIIPQSQLVDFGYVDLTGVTDLVPESGTTAITGGADGDPVVDADYVGSSSDGNGFYAFNPYDDAYAIACPEINTDAVNQGGSAYASSRKDLVFFAHLPNTDTTSSALVSTRSGLSIDDKYTQFWAGGSKVRNLNTGEIEEISELGNVLGNLAYVQATFGPWYSNAGRNKAKIPNIVGPVNNFGTPASVADLDALANAQINVLMNRDNINQLSGNFSGQVDDNVTKFANVVMLLIYLKKSLRPILETYLEEPNDITLFKRIFNHVKPFLDSLKTPAKRALFDYEWLGDQDANSLDDLQINNRTDVLNGKYLIKFKIIPIVSLQELTVDIILTPSLVDFQ